MDNITRTKATKEGGRRLAMIGSKEEAFDKSLTALIEFYKNSVRQCG